MKRNLFLSLLAIFVLLEISKAQIVELQGINCPGEFTGKLGVVTDFGTEPYTYLWNTGETTNIISGLSSGFYSVSVTDALLVNRIFNYNLNDPLPITNSYLTTNNSSWPNPTGTISVTSSGGTGWYAYYLQDSTSQRYINQSGPNFSNLYSGTYYLETFDLNGCQRKDTVLVGEDAGIIPNNFDIDYTACYEGTAPIDIEPGTIQVPALIIIGEDTTTIVKIIPGPRPYINSLNDTLSVISGNVLPGKNEFKIVTSDNKGFRYSWFVDSVLTPIKITWEQENVLCHGGNTGRIIVLAEGSYNDFSYRITGPNSFSSNNSSINNLYAGNYTVTAEDSTGCSISQSIIIEEPIEPLRIHFETFKTFCPESEDGKIYIRYIENGLPPFSYLWSTGNVSFEIDSLEVGWYNLRVTDSNGCIALDSAQITGGNEVCVPTVITPNGDGHNDFFNVNNLCYYSDIKIVITDNLGKIIFETNDCNNLWDGKDKSGNLVDSKTTVFVYIEQTKNDGTVKKFRKTVTVLY